ncbi:MAG: hypothetical protein LBH93_08820 [Chitinispirillales bacterium]|jgi:hypothetical protein|nr:hypothetical protein [Chitinispirillales bacterium]
MKLSKCLAAALCIAALSTGAFAGQEGSGAKSGDSAAAEASAPATKQSQSKQASVQKTTKKTNWSKIKTLFE